MEKEITASILYFQLEPSLVGKPCTSEYRLDYEGKLGEYHRFNDLRRGTEDMQELETFLKTNNGCRVVLNIGLRSYLCSSKNVFQLDDERKSRLNKLVESHNKSLSQN